MRNLGRRHERTPDVRGTRASQVSQTDRLSTEMDSLTSIPRRKKVLLSKVRDGKEGTSQVSESPLNYFTPTGDRGTSFVSRRGGG